MVKKSNKCLKMFYNGCGSMKYNFNSEEDIWDLEEELMQRYESRRYKNENMDSRHY